jgi:hypothetical protein
MGTTDFNRIGSASRTTPLLTLFSNSPVFDQSLDVIVTPNDLFSVRIVSKGYSPLHSFETGLTTSQCLSVTQTSTSTLTTMPSFFTSDLVTFTTDIFTSTTGIVEPPAASLFSQTIGSSKIAALIALLVLFLVLLCLLCHAFWKRIHDAIVFNFVLALLCALCFWVFTSERDNFFGYRASSSTCQITGGFLHFFFLASFMFVSRPTIDVFHCCSGGFVLNSLISIYPSSFPLRRRQSSICAS